jgi:hypothetical protein
LFDRELTQLISTAKQYLDMAEAVIVPTEELAITVSANQARWSDERRPNPLSSLDIYSAHLASCATRLATIHEILRGGTEKAWAVAYPNRAAISATNLSSARSQALEILVRDYVAHAEEPQKQANRSAFRKAALDDLTFKELGEQLRTRYHVLAAELEQEHA